MRMLHILSKPKPAGHMYEHDVYMVYMYAHAVYMYRMAGARWARQRYQ